MSDNDDDDEHEMQDVEDDGNNDYVDADHRMNLYMICFNQPHSHTYTHLDNDK